MGKPRLARRARAPGLWLEERARAGQGAPPARPDPDHHRHAPGGPGRRLRPRGGSNADDGPTRARGRPRGPRGDAPAAHHAGARLPAHRALPAPPRGPRGARARPARHEPRSSVEGAGLRDRWSHRQRRRRSAPRARPRLRLPPGAKPAGRVGGDRYRAGARSGGTRRPAPLPLGALRGPALALQPPSDGERPGGPHLQGPRAAAPLPRADRRGRGRRERPGGVLARPRPVDRLGGPTHRPLAADPRGARTARTGPGRAHRGPRGGLRRAGSLLRPWSERARRAARRALDLLGRGRRRGVGRRRGAGEPHRPGAHRVAPDGGAGLRVAGVRRAQCRGSPRRHGERSARPTPGLLRERRRAEPLLRPRSALRPAPDRLLPPRSALRPLLERRLRAHAPRSTTRPDPRDGRGERAPRGGGGPGADAPALAAGADS